MEVVYRFLRVDYRQLTTNICWLLTRLQYVQMIARASAKDRIFII